MKNQGKKYDIIAKEFANARPKTLSEKKYLDLLVKGFPPGAQILDIGCGSGEPIASFLIDLGFIVTGVDVSRELLSMAKSNFPTMQCIYGDMRSISIENKFDAVIAYDSFFHLPDNDQKFMISRFASWLRNYGRLLFTSGPEEGEVIESEMFGEKFSYYSLSPKMYIKTLESNGFKVLLQEMDIERHLVWVAEKQVEKNIFKS